ncbi:hypothetical protein, partial [Acinetobacter baumannii]|uniref:hypothetical protein n=1 Tax=Acinetobacter baumannii TaxID=470 RepID=UPI00209189EC
ATGAVILAIPAALAIARFAFPGRGGIVALFLSPLVIPHIVLGVAFLRFFTEIGVTGTFAGRGAGGDLARRLALDALPARNPALDGSR